MDKMRRGGVLVHPTALPGPWGAGDLDSVMALFGWMSEAGLNIWQFLPLGPTDPSGSPYNSGSGFARDPNLIALDGLVRDGWLLSRELPSRVSAYRRVDFAAVAELRREALARASERVAEQVDLGRYAWERKWADDWALFSAAGDQHGGAWQHSTACAAPR